VGYQEFPLPLFFPLSLSLSLPLTLSPPLSLSPSTGRRSPTRTRYGRSTVNRVGVSSVCPFSNPVSYRHERRNSHHNCAHWEEEQQQHPSTTRRTTLSLYRRWLPSGSSLFFGLVTWPLLSRLPPHHQRKKRRPQGTSHKYPPTANEALRGPNAMGTLDQPHETSHRSFGGRKGEPR
jgi:hypothetical protein